MDWFDISCLDNFSRSYTEAREKFLQASADAGAETESLRHPDVGPDGEALYLDAARLGRRDAPNLFVAVSGTHGPEGFCGSGCQTGWLRSPACAELPEDVAVLLVHAHNPFGFGWGVRQTQEKVDLNRNFVDHARPPGNDLCDRFYERLGPFPEQWSEAFLEHFQATREAFYETEGKEETERWLGYGQYRFPHGLHFGGMGPTWSRRALERLLGEHAAAARRVVLIDFHTGLGRYGYGELLSVDMPDTPAFARSRAIFGESVRSMPGGDAAATYSAGNLSEGVRDVLSHAEVTAHALEFGTYEGPGLQPTKIKCQWLLARDRLGDPDARAVREAYRAIFYPETDDWKELVTGRAMMVCRQAVAWLAHSE